MFRPTFPSSLACIALLATSAVQAAELAVGTAPNANMRYVAASMQRDARHDQAVLGLLSLPVGERWWGQIGGGQVINAQDDDARHSSVVSGAMGYIGDAWQASLTASHRSDGSRFRQTDWAGTLEWRGDRFSAGVDGSYRDAKLSGTVITSTALGGTTDAAVLQRVKGGGIGAHGSLQATEALSVYAAAMRYHYQATTQQDGSAASPPSLALASALQTSPSFVSRDETTLSRSGKVGASYRFAAVTLSGELLADNVLDVPGTVRTTQLKAAVAMTPGWTATPVVGRTQSETYGSVNFGGLALTHAW
jgi:hypothetical protein